MADIQRVKIELLTAEAFEPFGEVLEGGVRPLDVKGSGVSSGYTVNFQTDGTPRVQEPPFTDVGTWGAFGSPSVTVPARSPLTVPFTVTPPQGAEPGDHVGIVVVEHQAETPPEALPIRHSSAALAAKVSTAKIDSSAAMVKAERA